MNAFVLFLFAILTPIVQPLVQQGASRLQNRLQNRQETRVTDTQVAPTPYVVYHNGEWWKFENGQWWVWRQNGNGS